MPLALSVNNKRSSNEEIEMKHINKEFTLLASILRSKNGRMIVLVLTIALFVLSAGAPNAAGAIGK